MDELELLERSRPEVAPSPDIVARHRLALTEAMASPQPEAYPATDAPRRRVWLTALTAAAVVLAGVAAGLLSRGEHTPTRVVTAPPAGQPTTTVASGRIVPCGSHIPAAIAPGGYEHDTNEMDPATVTVRIYACRLDRMPPETVTGADGRSRETVTTLRELMERFGGLEGSVIDEFGRAHPISLAPLAAADPDTTAVGLAWAGRPRDAPPRPPGAPAAPPWPQTLDPPWLERPRN